VDASGVARDDQDHAGEGGQGEQTSQNGVRGMDDSSLNGIASSSVPGSSPSTIFVDWKVLVPPT
jgi:hypothetical protein